MPSISIIIPNWNGASLLSQHLPSVVKEAHGAEIIIVDDASDDESGRVVRSRFPKIKVIEKKSRDGYASTVNVGVQAAQGDIVVLLNTDVEPEPGFLNPLISHFSDPSVFAVGCLERSVEGGLTVLRGRGEAMWRKGFFVHWRGEIDRYDTAWVSGGSGAFRRDLWLKLGGMDEMYNPFYWEDIDLSYRAIQSGYKLVFEPRSIVNHFHEKGNIKRTFSPWVVNVTAYRNQFIFIWKNLSDPSQLTAHMIWTPIRIIQTLVSGDPWMFVGWVYALRYVPHIIITRLRKT